MKWIRENIKNKIDLLLLVSGAGPFVVMPLFLLVNYITDEFNHRQFVEEFKSYSSQNRVKVNSNCYYLYLFEEDEIDLSKLYKISRKLHETDRHCNDPQKRPYEMNMTMVDTLTVNTRARFSHKFNNNISIISILFVSDRGDSSIHKYAIDTRYITEGKH